METLNSYQTENTSRIGVGLYDDHDVSYEKTFQNILATAHAYTTNGNINLESSLKIEYSTQTGCTLT